MPDITLTADVAYVGVSAGIAVTTGVNNVLVGPYAAYKVTTGNYNVALGYTALGTLTTGSENTAVGWRAGNNAKVSVTQLSVFGYRAGYNMAGGGDYSTGVGAYSLEQAQGASNTAVGAESGKSITTGNANTFVGRRAGRGTSQKADAVESIAIGHAAFTTKDNQVVLGADVITETVLRGEIKVGSTRLARLWPTEENYFLAGSGPAVEPSGHANTAVGSRALANVAEGLCCTAVGFNALNANVTGVDHTAVGAGAMENLNGGVGCSAFGRLAMRDCVTGTNNTAMGDASLKYVLSSGNSGLGYAAGFGNTTGEKNTFAGVYAGGLNTGNPEDRSTYSFACAFGAETFALNQTGDYNCAFGYRSLHNVVGGENVGIGAEALRNIYTGSEKNSALGHIAGSGLTDNAVRNLFLGHRAGVSGPEGTQKADAVNSVGIGSDVVTTADNQVVLGNSSVTETVLRGVQQGTVIAVSALPSPSAGARSFVSDSTVGAIGNFGVIVAGGGSDVVPVWGDGANWRIG